MNTEIREDLQLADSFRAAGWIVSRNQFDSGRKHIFFPLTFSSKINADGVNTWIWKVGNQWRCAESSATKYFNHRIYTTLQEAYDKEVTCA